MAYQHRFRRPMPVCVLICVFLAGAGPGIWWGGALMRFAIGTEADFRNLLPLKRLRRGDLNMRMLHGI